MASRSTATVPSVGLFEPLLEGISEGRHDMTFRKGEKVFSQGDRADDIYFLHTGRVKMSVVSSAGREAVLALVGPQEFFGEGALIGHLLHMSSAMTLQSATVLRIEKRAMLRALHISVDLSAKFMNSLLKRTIDLEEDLCDQLFNQSEKRLARVLLKLTHLRELPDASNATIPKLSHETLAEMVGTTRSRVSHFMNKFRKMGLIEYSGHLAPLKVRAERLNDVVLHG